MSVKRYLLIFLVLSPLFAISLIGLKIYYATHIWRYQGENKIFKIASGEGFSSINNRLYKEGFIKSAKIFYRYAQFNDLIMKFKKGTYRVLPGMNMIEMAHMFTSGHSIYIKTTIPEGKNIYQIAGILKSNGVISSKQDFIDLCKDPVFLGGLGIKGPSCEGYLFPNTYQFYPLSPLKDVIKTFYGTFNKYTRKLDFSQTKLSPYEVIILASIVEKETGAPWERAIIAGVFHNRLKKGMRLQSDPTTIYGIWENYRGNLKKRHLLQKTPYNTYKLSGLPVGPIANPGSASIEAVLRPQKHSYLYFVSQNDGTHVFSKNYKDHQKAVRKYQKKRSGRVGKSWRDLKKK